MSENDGKPPDVEQSAIEDWTHPDAWQDSSRAPTHARLQPDRTRQTQHGLAKRPLMHETATNGTDQSFTERKQ